MFPYINNFEAWVLFFKVVFYFAVSGLLLYVINVRLWEKPTLIIYRAVHITASIGGLLFGFNYLFM